MSPKRWPLVVILAVGLGLAAAPALFQLFTRAPAGGRMIDSFQPIMTQAKVTEFRRYMAEIGQGETEAAGPLTAAARSRAGGQDFAGRYPSVVAFEQAWPGIDADMGSMLSTMQRDLPDYQAVRALPPFWMFPWFFVLPGLMIAAAALWTLARPGSARRGTVVLAALGLAVVAAPAVFQMFTRAPRGAQMISDFKPLMTPARVTRVQGYFLTIGAAEGQLRTQVLPAASSGGPGTTGPSFPAVTRWSRDWPHISSEMAPMIGAMSDNLANFGDVAALPPFWMFPWFFVLPGVIVFGMALTARPGAGAQAVEQGRAPTEALTVEARGA